MVFPDGLFRPELLFFPPSFIPLLFFSQAIIWLYLTCLNYLFGRCWASSRRVT